jgi:PKD repeat protein
VNPPTSDKPQSKLWWNDGSWWADMFDSASGTWHIFRLDRSTERWVDTTTVIDTRANTLGDALWDGTHLYVASHLVTVSTNTSPVASIPSSPARLYRFSYSPISRTYSLDPGFPVTITTWSSESMTIDKDSTGVLWATWTQVSGSGSSATNAVYVNSTVGNDATWGTPFVMPVAGAAPSPDDISAVVSYGGNKIGVMWSNQLDGTVYWAVHVDGTAVGQWRGSTALRGNGQADDHLNVKSLQSDAAGRVYAAIKTSADSAGLGPTAALIDLLVFKPATGAWNVYTFGTVADCHTRPIVMLDGEHGIVHMFATAPTGSSCPFTGYPGSIYEKTAPMDSPVFPSGRGTPVIQDPASPSMNNATSTKQGVTSATGLVVLAGNDVTSRYWHMDESLAGTPLPTAAFSASPTSGPAPLAVAFTDTSTGSPTGWSWDFGDGSAISTLQNLAHTYAAAGTYTVTLTVSNIGGSSSATQTISATGATGSGERGVWLMDEGSGTTIVDSSGLGNTGTLTGSPLWTAGWNGLGLHLNGTSDYATVPNAPSLDIQGPITLAAWVKPERVATQYVIKKALLGTSNGYELSLASTGKVFFRLNQATSLNTYRIDSTTSYPVNGTTWMHIAATYDGTTMRLYINGVQQAAIAGPAAIGSNGQRLGIGAQPDGVSPFQGTLDEVRIWARALSATEIQALLTP